MPTTRLDEATGARVMDKKTLRRRIKERIAVLDRQIQADKSRRICAQVVRMPEFVRASVVMVYLSIADEVDLSDVVYHAWQQDKTVVAPKIDWTDRRLTAVEIHSLDGQEFERSWSGLRNPRDGEPVPQGDIGLALVPGLAFDAAGGRLGRGGGFYDRFLASGDLGGPAFGVGFEEQLVDAVPMEPHDHTMDGVVTDERIIRCAPQGGPGHG